MDTILVVKQAMTIAVPLPAKRKGTNEKSNILEMANNATHSSLYLQNIRTPKIDKVRTTTIATEIRAT